MENWKPIKGYEGLYEVSDEGRIRSLDRIVKHSEGHTRIQKGKLIALKTNNKGYLIVILSKDGVTSTKLVHRIVYESFHGEIPPDMIVNHIDENPQNPKLTNLNLLTQKQNCNWGFHNEKLSLSQSKKAVYGYDKDGKLVISFKSTLEADKHGYNHRHISECANGKEHCKSHKGIRWSYEPQEGIEPPS